MWQCRARGRPDRSRRAPGRERGADERVLTAGVPGVGGARGRERAGPTRSHPEPGRDPAQRRRVLWGRPHGRRGRRGHPPPSVRRASGPAGQTARWREGPLASGLAGQDDPQRIAERSEPRAPSQHPSRGGAAAARWAHNPKVGGSNPPPATSIRTRPSNHARSRFVVLGCGPDGAGTLPKQTELLHRLLATRDDHVGAYRDRREECLEVCCALEEITEPLGDIT
jgi:hypothetical protein